MTPRVTTRLRDGEFVPYIALGLPLCKQDAIAEIVIGPAAPPNAENGIRAMLDELGIDAPIRRSDIPYRAR